MCTCLSWRLLRRDRWSLWRLPFAEARCRVPPRRAGNFGVHITSLREMSEPPLREHLLAQMKVTKAKGLIPHPIPLRDSSDISCSVRPEPRAKCPRGGTFRTLSTACAAHLARGGSRLGKGDQVCGKSVTWVAFPKAGSISLGASEALSRRRSLAERKSNRMLSWGLCFGDFHLPQQMFAQRGFTHFAQRSDVNTKVTRPPGRDPASSLGTRQAARSQGGSA